ncbi:unnamed protein product [Zymoseptoria tritici ST99CH_1E4]|uniref:MYND-type domain-containing protein n=1 Tax=Zymoseptoria tritici ST99CH_1E4 TaxID=1276532 RepID=A0A2H1FMA1_ZYMTR|nr:unnamed protein product [Zymoseptoria tritici ST99CH_1E4]
MVPMVEDEPERSSSGDSEPERSSSDEPDQNMPDAPDHNFQDEPGHINQDEAPECAVCSAEENVVPCSGCRNIHYCSTECAQLDHDFHSGNCDRPGLVEIADPLTGGKYPICANCSRKKSKEGLPLLHCGRCRKMHYCGDACAEKHWAWHSLTCKAAGKEPSVSSSSSQGPANETPQRRQKIVECANCSDGQSVGGGPLGYCTICGLVRYCSSDCEQADREWHSLTCRRREDIASESKSGGPTYLDNNIDNNFSGGPKIRLAPKKKAIKSTRPLVFPEHVNQKAIELNKLIEEGGRLFLDDGLAGRRTPSSPTTTASSDSSPTRKPRDRSRTPPQSRPQRTPPPQNLPPRLSPEPSLVRILSHQPTPPHFRTLSFLTNLQPDHWTDGAALLPFAVYNPALHAY